MFIDDFETINARRSEDDQHSNPRNLGNGVIGRSDGEENQFISLIAFNAFEDEATLSKSLDALDDLGITTVVRAVFNGKPSEVVEKVQDFYTKMKVVRDDLAYEIDGLVVCIDDTELRNRLVHDKQDHMRPKHSVAIKFKARSATTKVIGCELTLGHQGQVIPTAKLEPVHIGGVTVSNVLLNNWNEDSAYPSAAHVAIGDTVEIERAGDVIPKLVTVIIEAEDREPIEEPAEFMGYETTRFLRGKKGAVTYIVGGEGGEAIAKQKIKHYIGNAKKGMGILGVGPALLDSLTDVLVRTPADLYCFVEKDIVDLQIGQQKNGQPIRLGKSRATSLLLEIEKSKKTTVSKLLGALGIELLGRRRVEIIAKEQGIVTLDDWLDDTKLKTIRGDTIRASIRKGINDNRDLIADLLAVGVEIADDTTKKGEEMNQATEDRPFAGLSFCFTGTRDGLGEVEELGGIIKSGVSKGLDFLVQKDPTRNTNKSMKAEQLGVKIIGIDTLREVLNGDRELVID